MLKVRTLIVDITTLKILLLVCIGCGLSSFVCWFVRMGDVFCLFVSSTD